jgi:catechol 2,3-dioxygenase-like lactoylglutathione lyase family enzyme
MPDGLRITHLGVCVSDLDRSIAFYRDGLGMEEVGRLHVAGEPTATLFEMADVDLDLVYLQRDGLRIELIGYGGPGPRPAKGPRPMDEPGFTHLSVRIADPGVLVERLVGLGGRALAATEVVFARGNRGVMVLDPDGVRIELIEDGE